MPTSAEPPPVFDAPTWRVLVVEVGPLLRTYPSVRAWAPACGVGAPRAWAVAALLEDAGLLARAHVYATDADEAVVGAARVAPPAWAPAGAAERMVFCAHDVATDGSPNEFQLVACGDALEDVAADDAALAARVVALVRESLCRRGVVVAGPLLGARFAHDGGWERIDEAAGVFRSRA